MTKNTNGLHAWFKQNLWAFIIIVSGTLIAIGVFQQRVSALEIGFSDLEIKVNQYPTERWFDSKFENIDKRFEMLEKKIDNR